MAVSRYFENKCKLVYLVEFPVTWLTLPLVLYLYWCLCLMDQWSRSQWAEWRRNRHIRIRIRFLKFFKQGGRWTPTLCHTWTPEQKPNTAAYPLKKCKRGPKPKGRFLFVYMHHHTPHCTRPRPRTIFQTHHVYHLNDTCIWSKELWIDTIHSSIQHHHRNGEYRSSSSVHCTYTWCAWISLPCSGYSSPTFVIASCR